MLLTIDPYITHNRIKVDTEHAISTELYSHKEKNIKVSRILPNWKNFISEENLVKLTNNQARILNFDVPSYYYTNKKKLYNQYDIELKNFKKENIEEASVNSTFQKIVSSVSELPFYKSDVEILSDNIKFSFLFKDDFMVLITKPFEVLEDVNSDEIIFSIFKNRELILSNVSKPSIFVEVFNECFEASILSDKR